MNFKSEAKKKVKFLPSEDLENILRLSDDERWKSVIRYNRKREGELYKVLCLIDPIKNPQGIISAQNLIAGINDLEKFIAEEKEERRIEMEEESKNN